MLLSQKIFNLLTPLIYNMNAFQSQHYSNNYINPLWIFSEIKLLGLNAITHCVLGSNYAGKRDKQWKRHSSDIYDDIGP